MDIPDDITISPCPFCKSTKDLQVLDDEEFYVRHRIETPYLRYAVNCANCGCNGPSEDTPNAAIASWNRLQAPCKASTVRDLWSACRHMQTRVHDINTQLWALQSILKQLNVRDRQVLRNVANIEKYTRYIYDGEEGFPDVAATLKTARDELMNCGEWKEWSDYTGFSTDNEGKKGK